MKKGNNKGTSLYRTFKHTWLANKRYVYEMILFRCLFRTFCYYSMIKCITNFRIYFKIIIENSDHSWSSLFWCCTPNSKRNFRRPLIMTILDINLPKRTPTKLLWFCRANDFNFPGVNAGESFVLATFPYLVRNSYHVSWCFSAWLSEKVSTLSSP